MSAAVLDSSAVLAWLHDEAGGGRIEPLLPVAVMSAVNWSETAQKIDQHGAADARVLSRLRALGLHVEPFTAEDAMTAADLWLNTRSSGLSLGDRACLAVAYRLGLPAVTADKAWGGLDLGVDVQLIR